VAYTKVKSLKSLFFDKFFVGTLSVLGVISTILLLTKHQAEYSVYILEGVFMLYAGLGFWWTKRSTAIPVVLAIRFFCFLYIGLSYIYAVGFHDANNYDFLLIYKSFVYLFFLSFLVGKRLMTYVTTDRLLIVLMSLFAMKYLFAIIIKHEERPILYMENNFELMFVYALYLVRYTVNKEKFLWLLGCAGIITLLSLSRSSLLMYSVLVLFVIYDSFKKTRVFIIPGAIMVLGVVVYLIFSTRSSSLEDVDRYRFMLVWWTQVKDWTLFEWLFGAPRISRLSDSACSYMNYFVAMFSRSGDGTCYSVVLHSFLLRVIYDHGLVALFFIIYACAKFLVKSGVRKDVTLVFISIVVINGLSVSSFNNLFFAISMVFLMTTNTKFQNEEEEYPEDKLNLLPPNALPAR
jgi:hypothetical protein